VATLYEYPLRINVQNASTLNFIWISSPINYNIHFSLEIIETVLVIYLINTINT